MGPPDLESEEVPDAGGEPVESTIRLDDIQNRGEMDEMGWLGEIVAQLEEDPEQCWAAVESLAAVDGEVRVAIVAALAKHRESPGVRALLRLLGSSRDPDLRSAAWTVLSEDELNSIEDEPGEDGGTGEHPGGLARIEGTGASPNLTSGRVESDLAIAPSPSSGRIVRSLITAIDGEGRGTIVISIQDGGHRRTAAFRCDVCRGILDVVGEVEAEQSSSGRLVRESIDQAEGDYVLDVPELALGLLGGSLRLSDPAVATRVRPWLDAAVGPGGLPAGLPPLVPGPEEAIPDDDLPAWADLVLDACPSWLDRSALTFELAEEITLREGPSTPDPVRDAGAYRYLFEHTLSRRLELYSRMLLWMGWVWHAAGRCELARSAFALAGQLSDEQYAVPSHPFTVALTTRSLRAAQAVLLTGDDPGPGSRRAGA